MSLRVQARDTKGNLFAYHEASSQQEALDFALAWILTNPGLTVEVVGVYA